MVADVKLQLEVLTVDHFLLDDLELMFVQEDVTCLRQVVHRNVETSCPVVENLHRELGRTDEAEHSGIYHLAVERHGNVFLTGSKLRGAGRVCLGAGIQGQTAGRASLQQHPGALERALDAVEITLRLRLEQHAPLLGPARARRISRRTEMQGHSILREHAA